VLELAHLGFQFVHNLGQPIRHARGSLVKPILEITLQIFRTGGQFTHDRHELLLSGAYLFGQERFCSRRPSEAKRRIELIDAPVGVDARIRLPHPPPVHQRCFAGVARLGRDRHQRRRQNWRIGAME
jgi:hypothetical protein